MMEGKGSGNRGFPDKYRCSRIDYIGTLAYIFTNYEKINPSRVLMSLYLL
jgi:hypothetical protein